MSNQYENDYQRMLDELEEKARREREQEEDEDLAELLRQADERALEKLRNI